MLIAGVVALSQALSPAAQALVDNSNDILIAGDGLDAEFSTELLSLPPDQRMLVIIHLRRSGLLGRAVVPIEWITAPQRQPVDGAE